jgi:Arc/MetJ family transcription regulator
MTVNGACVAMGWRKPTRTVVDTDDGLSDAVVRRLGPIDTVRQVWKRASQEQREEIGAERRDTDKSPRTPLVNAGPGASVSSRAYSWGKAPLERNVPRPS